MGRAPERCTPLGRAGRGAVPGCGVLGPVYPVRPARSSRRLTPLPYPAAFEVRTARAPGWGLPRPSSSATSLESVPSGSRSVCLAGVGGRVCRSRRVFPNGNDDVPQGVSQDCVDRVAPIESAPVRLDAELHRQHWVQAERAPVPRHGLADGRICAWAPRRLSAGRIHRSILTGRCGGCQGRSRVHGAGTARPTDRTGCRAASMPIRLSAHRPGRR